MSDYHPYIEVSAKVRERLHTLPAPDRNAIGDAIYGAISVDGRPFHISGRNSPWYICSLLGYCFLYRELTRAELALSGEDFGYLIFAMLATPIWLRRQLGG